MMCADSSLRARIFIFDARVLLFWVVLLFSQSWVVLVVTLILMTMMALADRKGVSFEQAFRYVHSMIIGKWRITRPYWRPELWY